MPPWSLVSSLPIINSRPCRVLFDLIVHRLRRLKTDVIFDWIFVRWFSCYLELHKWPIFFSRRERQFPVDWRKESHLNGELNRSWEERREEEKKSVNTRRSIDAYWSVACYISSRSVWSFITSEHKASVNIFDLLKLSFTGGEGSKVHRYSPNRYRICLQEPLFLCLCRFSLSLSVQNRTQKRDVDDIFTGKRIPVTLDFNSTWTSNGLLIGRCSLLDRLASFFSLALLASRVLSSSAMPCLVNLENVSMKNER